MNRSHHAFNTVSNSIPFNSSNVKKTRTPRKCIHKTKSIHTTPPHTYADCKKISYFLWDKPDLRVYLLFIK